MSGMVQIPRYINVEVTGCIGMTATFGCHLRPRHTEMSTEMIPTSPHGHRGNREASPLMGERGEVGDGGYRSVSAEILLLMLTISVVQTNHNTALWPMPMRRDRSLCHFVDCPMACPFLSDVLDEEALILRRAFRRERVFRNK
ncbi:hypothetical protein FQN60_018004 [Etheostoma spectabile]|uniref:Uncharacterized protein n=1 Tax=Etheostoma spectabile TaxID=54343 RepID=A0A5J5DH24_9PERO|nr:hypothetical protein FQN60_018004 [Etheostoma spectabile]